MGNLSKNSSCSILAQKWHTLALLTKYERVGASCHCKFYTFSGKYLVCLVKEKVIHKQLFVIYRRKHKESKKVVKIEKLFTSGSSVRLKVQKRETTVGHRVGKTGGKEEKMGDVAIYRHVESV